MSYHIIISLFLLIIDIVLLSLFFKNKEKFKILLPASIGVFFLFLLFLILTFVNHNKKTSVKSSNILSFIDLKNTNKAQIARLTKAIGDLKTQLAKYNIDLKAAQDRDNLCSELRDKPEKTKADKETLDTKCSTKSDVPRINALINTINYEIENAQKRIVEYQQEDTASGNVTY